MEERWQPQGCVQAYAPDLINGWTGNQMRRGTRLWRLSRKTDDNKTLYQMTAFFPPAIQRTMKRKLNSCPIVYSCPYPSLQLGDGSRQIIYWQGKDRVHGSPHTQTYPLKGTSCCIDVSLLVQTLSDRNAQRNKKEAYIERTNVSHPASSCVVVSIPAWAPILWIVSLLVY
jgi:hypothetical protein